MAPIDPGDADNSLENCARQLDQFVSVANCFHVKGDAFPRSRLPASVEFSIKLVCVKGDDKYTRSVECIFFMITNGRIPTINEMTTDEFGLRSMSDIDLVDLRISSRQWELQGLVPSGKALDHVSMYGTDRSSDANTENMYRMFVNLPAEVITQGMSIIHAEFSKFFRTEYFNGESNKTGGPLAMLRGIQKCFIEIQNRCVRATDDLSRLVIETAGQRPATLKDFHTQELALERQTQL